MKEVSSANTSSTPVMASIMKEETENRELVSLANNTRPTALTMATMSINNNNLHYHPFRLRGAWRPLPEKMRRRRKGRKRR